MSSEDDLLVVSLCGSEAFFAVGGLINVVVSDERVLKQLEGLRGYMQCLFCVCVGEGWGLKVNNKYVTCTWSHVRMYAN